MRVKNSSFRILIIGLILLIHSSLLAQTRTTSPYSIFGLGEINNTFNVKSLSMGGLSYSIFDNSTINFANPASYAAFDTLAFIFDAGMLANNLSLKTAAISEQTSYASLNYLSLGFSVNRWWKTSIGLVPYSNVGYNYGYVEDIANVGNVQFYDEGSGGVNQIYWGHAIKINKHLSAGVNISYYFGTIDKVRSVGFLDSTNFISTHFSNSISINDFNISYGLHYHTNINDLGIDLGAVYSNKASLKANQDEFARTFVPAFTDVEQFKDTISHIVDNYGKVIIPKNIGFGLMLSEKNKWKIGLEFQKQFWEEYQSFNVSDSLKNTFRFGLGFEIIPNYNSVSSYFKRVSYRFGLRYEQTPLSINNTRINDFGISFGIGLPLRNSRSTVNLAMEYGQRGTMKNNLIRERYFKLMIGITMHQNWFHKRKYD
jgi:long-subunit fatty acid transport protein